MFLFWRVDDDLKERTEKEYLEDEESQRALFFLSRKKNFKKERFINCIKYYSEVSGDGAEKRPLVGKF